MKKFGTSNVLVTYFLDNTATINITVHDVTGRTVMEKSQMMLAGRHSTALSVGNLNPGVYFVQLTAPGYKQTEKIAVIR